MALFKPGEIAIFAPSPVAGYGHPPARQEFLDFTGVDVCVQGEFPATQFGCLGGFAHYYITMPNGKLATCCEKALRKKPPPGREPENINTVVDYDDAIWNPNKVVA